MILELALALSLHRGPDEHPGGDRWFSADKAKHFFLSAFIQSASYSGFRTLRMGHGASLGGAWAVSVVLGAGKELEDRRRGSFVSPRDLIWDAAGAGAATALLQRAKP